MSRRDAPRVEELLRSDAETVRRDPSPGVAARVRAAIASPARRDAVDIDAADARGGRSRFRDVAVAASVLAAAGLWIFAFAGGIGSGPGTETPGLRPGSARSGASARAESDAPSLLSQLARVTPRAIGSAVDASLLGELDRMAQDATRTARFLASRVPASLVARAEDAPR